MGSVAIITSLASCAAQNWTGDILSGTVYTLLRKEEKPTGLFFQSLFVLLNQPCLIKQIPYPIKPCPVF
jgi:hypothetical protein